MRNLSRDVSASNLSLPKVVWEQLEGRNPGSAPFQRLGEGLAQENLGRNFTPAQLLWGKPEISRFIKPNQQLVCCSPWSGAWFGSVQPAQEFIYFLEMLPQLDGNGNNLKSPSGSFGGVEGEPGAAAAAEH